MNTMPVGVDIAKNVIQVHYIDKETGEILNKAIKRVKFLDFFANQSPCLIGMEASGGAHHWARQLSKMGHHVKLMPGNSSKHSTFATRTTQLMRMRSGGQCNSLVRPLP